MYLAIITLPLLAALVAGLLGRKVGVTGSQLITSSSIIMTAGLSLVAFFEVGLSNSGVSIKLLSWIDSEYLNVNWGFQFDALTVSMLIPVLIVSALVHVYSMGYMSEDPHQQRFFSYLSMFTFFMLVLVTGDNYLVMFIGWEGIHLCLKWLDLYLNIIDQTSLMVLPLTLSSVNFTNGLSNKIKSDKRIGPHNIDIISLIVGSTLGDSHLEKRDKGIGTRVIFEQSNKNVEYLMWFHQYLSSRGYCRKEKPVLHKRIKEHGQIVYHYRINSYTFTSFNWIREMFYKENGEKIIPLEIKEYITPFALAIWFMDDGSKLGKGAKIATNGYELHELKSIIIILKEKYNVEATYQTGRGGINKGHLIYIPSKSMPLFSSLVKPHILPSMLYKLGQY
jgi:LAGLIDADG DNA endonuclease family/NADH-Ubiquinone oxidoreductase (complex I), chain 5 N-terminus